MSKIKKIKYIPKIGKTQELLDLLQIRDLISKGESDCNYYEISQICIQDDCEIEVATSWRDLKSYELWTMQENNEKIEEKILQVITHTEEQDYKSANPEFSKEFVKELKNKYSDLIPQNAYNEDYVGENERLNSEIEKLKDANMRLLADIQNQKRIFEKDKENIRLYSSEEFVKNIVVTMDTLQAALKYTKEEEGQDYKKEYENLIEGIGLTIGKLEEIFIKNNIETIEAKGEFDPEIHQAISVLNSQDFNNNEIVEVVQNGYKYNDKVIRPSMVVVCKKEG